VQPARQGRPRQQLQDRWKALLHQGTGVEVRVVDVMRAGDARPFARLVRWTEIAPDGARTERSLSFLNAHNPLTRRLQDVPATDLPPGWVAPVIPIRR
jgi:hypothetical protein